MIEHLEHVDESRMKYICNKIIENRLIQISNSSIWTAFLDDQLREFVIQYNFNFFEVANRFHEFIAFPYKYDFSEDEIRRHWSFLHACRYLNKEIDDEYYDKLKARAKEESKEQEKLVVEDHLDLEKEQKEIEKYRAQRFNLIEINSEGGKNMENLSKDKNIYDNDNPVDQILKNDEHFEKCIENIELRKNENVTTNENYGLESVVITHNNEGAPYKLKDSAQDIKVDTTLKPNNNNSFNVSSNLEKRSEPSIGNIENDNTANSVPNKTIEQKINPPEDEDIIDALFKVSQKMQVDDEMLKNLTISGDEYKKAEKNEEDLFPINIKNLPEHNLSEEELIRYRESMLSGYCDDSLYRELNNTKTLEELIKEDPKLKSQYENLNTYFNFAVKSMNYFIPKINRSLDEGKKNKLQIESIDNEGKNIHLKYKIY